MNNWMVSVQITIVQITVVQKMNKCSHSECGNIDNTEPDDDIIVT